jgi:hypothetical protein
VSHVKEPSLLEAVSAKRSVDITLQSCHRYGNSLTAARWLKNVYVLIGTDELEYGIINYKNCLYQL